MRIACTLALVCVLSWQTQLQDPVSAAPGCRPVVQPLITLPGRVDSLLAASESGAVMALVGQPGSPVRYLPHDSLVVFHTGQSRSAATTTSLPQYFAAPGLAATMDGRLYVLVDSTLLTLDALTGRVTARQDLAMQAIGWPAAITTDPHGTIYLVGQPAGALADQVDAFVPDGKRVLRLRWRAPLGTTHAGTWIGLADPHTLAAYAPTQQDVHGTVALLDLRAGAAVHSYSLPAPPVADDAALDRIYVGDAGTIRAFTLTTGKPIATVAGATPLAANVGTGLVAFVRDRSIVLADPNNLRVLRKLPFPHGASPTALAWQGLNLLVGTDNGITSVGLAGCPA